MHCKTLECGGGTLYERHSQHNSIVHWKTLDSMSDTRNCTALNAMQYNTLQNTGMRGGTLANTLSYNSMHYTVLNTLDYIRMQWRNISKLRALIKVGENGTA